MFSKRGLPDRSNVPPAKRLRQNVVDLFLGNDISGQRAASIFRDAAAAGASHFQDLARIGSRPGAGRNQCRDILRAVVKRTAWPKLYVAPVRVWNRKRQQEETVDMPFLLPHELLHALLKRGSKATLLGQEGMCEETRAHMQRACDELRATELLGVGLWLDGVPCNWDRTESLEVVTMSLPGLTGRLGNIRLPLTVINKVFCIKHKTLDDILSVISWSFRSLAEGIMPSCRHDGSAWQASDVRRSKLAALPVGVRGVLAEVRGDWACYKSVFRLPAHNELAGCCWRCAVTPAGIREVGVDAQWRRPEERLSHWALIHRMRGHGLTLSPLFSVPAFKTSIFLLDWLHCTDQGVAADFLGQLFWMLLPKLAGDSKEQQCSSLWLNIVQYYQDTPGETMYDNMTLTMIRKSPAVPPKLRGRAAEVRGLAPFAAQVAQELLSDADLVESTAKQCASHLLACYNCLSAVSFDPDQLASHSRRLCLLWVALEAATPEDHTLWRVKPKLHLFQELCESGSRPSTCWTYRDEDFGGSLSKLSRRRGGKKTPASTAQSVLYRFIAQHPVPSAL